MIGTGNDRLDHGEAPGMTRICGRTFVMPGALWSVAGVGGPQRAAVLVDNHVAVILDRKVRTGVPPVFEAHTGSLSWS